MWHSLKALSALALETAWVKVTELVSIHDVVVLRRIPLYF
jgi:hypothetical protein